MTDLLAIDRVTLGDVQSAVRASLRGGVDAAGLDEFLTAVDWSGVQDADPPVVDLLSRLEALTTDYFEGVLALSGFVAGLLLVMPEGERQDLLPMNGTALLFTPAAPDFAVEPEEAPPLLRTGPATLAPA